MSEALYLVGVEPPENLENVFLNFFRKNPLLTAGTEYLYLVSKKRLFKFTLRTGVILKTRHVLAIVAASFALKSIQGADPALKAVFVLQLPFASGDYGACNSDAALKLYKKMGYNTIIEEIRPPNSASAWNTTSPTSWTINAPERTALVNRISEQRARVNALGMDYSPYYAEWGWNTGSIEVSERSRASIYREVDYMGPTNYNTDIYPALSKTMNQWVAPIAWASDFSSATLSIRNSEETNGAIIDFSRATSGSSALRTGQYYNLKVTVTIPTGNPLKVNDEIGVYYYQTFAAGQRPNSATVPLGFLTPNDMHILTYNKFLVKEVLPNGIYRFTDSYGQDITGSNFSVSLLVLVEDTFSLHPTSVFNPSARWEFQLVTGSGSRTDSSKAIFSEFEVKAIDPTTRMAYPNWEKNQASNYFSAYPDESAYMKSKMDYLLTDRLITDAPYSDTQSKFSLKRIKSHFLPTYENTGGQVIRKSIDPLSPSHDLIAKEMIKVIKDGLGGQEPKYYNLAGDEALVFRKDNVSRRGGTHPTYGSVRNGNYYARVMEKEIQRYKTVFNIPAGTDPTAKFLVWADMFTQSGYGWHIYSEDLADEEALAYWQSKSLQGKIIPVIWSYDYTNSLQQPSQILLENAADVQKSITPMITRGFKYVAQYATDGTMANIMAYNPSVNTDAKHIQHEIDMARNWRNIVQSPGNQAGFEGFIYTGWAGALRVNEWNGLYSLAYHGWFNKSATDLPTSWKAADFGPDYREQPVLNLLIKNSWPPVDAQPAIRSLLQ